MTALSNKQNVCHAAFEKVIHKVRPQAASMVMAGCSGERGNFSFLQYDSCRA